MNRRNMKDSGRKGRLQEMAPLANAYVPFQLESPPKYEPRKALIRGTLYSGLDLPFMGMVNNNLMNVNPMTDLQTLAFAIQELALYLDTHREDKEALETYQAYQKLYHKCMMEYNKNHRPLDHGTPSEGPYKWLDDPWPWEYCANKEA